MKPLYNKLVLFAVIMAIALSCSDLKKHEIARVQFESHGCFGSEQNELTLFEVDGLTKAKLEIKGDTVYESNVDQQGLESFYEFVNELRSVKKTGYCTTELSCKVNTGTETIERTLIPCRWDGFEYLKGALFKGQGIGKMISYEEKMNDSTINLDFGIRYDNYNFYFNVQEVTSWCDKRIKLKDGLEPWYKSIKEEVNRVPVKYFTDNHSWLMAIFTPRIVDANTKEDGKSLLIKHLDTHTADRIYFVITPQNDTIRLFDTRDRVFDSRD